MLLIVWFVCWLVCCASLVADFIRPRRQRDPRRTRYLRLSEASLMVVATGGILSYFLNAHQRPGPHDLRMVADAIQLAGFLSAVSFGLAARRCSSAQRG